MDFSQLLKTVCPWIGAALGGPLGSLAVTAASEALGLSEKTSEGLKNALAGVTADQMLALKKADQDFAVRMQELGFKNQADLEAIAAGDRKSARDMQAATHSRVPALLTLFLTLGMSGLLGTLIFHGIPDSPVVQLLLGSYTTAWTGSTVYWFGSTAGSLAKSKLLADSAPVK